MKHLLILLSFLLLSSPLFGKGEETGVLFLRVVNGECVWLVNGDEEKDGKYVGELKNWKPNGYGTITYPDRFKYDGECNERKIQGFKRRDTSPEKYVGGWKDGLLHGQGTWTFSVGGKYVGEFKEGKRNGHGTITYPDGGKYVGQWKDGEWDGQGTYTSLDKGKYEGEFKNSEWNGQGTFTSPDGDEGVGEYRGNKPWNIIIYDKNGKIIGKYENGKGIKQ